MQSTSRDVISAAIVGVLAGALLMAMVPAMAAQVGDALGLGETNVISQRTVLRGNAPVANLQVRNTGGKGALRAISSKNAVRIRVDPGESPLSVNPSAGTAKNLSADEVDGRDAVDLAPRVAAAGRDGTTFAHTAFAFDVLTTEIMVPAQGLLVIGGQLEIERLVAGSDNMICSFEVNGDLVTSSQLWIEPEPLENDEENCNLTATIEVGPGTHQVDLHLTGVDDDTKTRVGQGNLWVLWAPVDGTTGTFRKPELGL